MVRALRVVTVERGVDPRRFALLAFGGAGPLHAPAIAEELGITEILCPAASGVLAALGLVVSPRRRDAQRTVLLSGAELTRERVSEVVDELARAGRQALKDGDAGIAATYELRYRGQAFELAIPGVTEPDPDDLRSGPGIRFMEGAVLAVPLVGTYIQMFLFGGEFPGTDIIPRPTSSYVYGCEGNFKVFRCPTAPGPEETVTALAAIIARRLRTPRITSLTATASGFRLNRPDSSRESCSEPLFTAARIA